MKKLIFLRSLMILIILLFVSTSYSAIYQDEIVAKSDEKDQTLTNAEMVVMDFAYYLIDAGEEFFIYGAKFANRYAIYNMEMIYAILALSALLFIIRLRRIRLGTVPLKKILHTFNWILLLMVSLLEMFYVASLGQQVTWPCKPDQVGWLWTVINFLIFSFVLYNQLMCYLNILRDLQYHSYASFSWKWGLYSWPIAIAIAVICSFFYEPGLIFVGVLFLIAQLVQLGIIFRRVIPKGGWMYAFLCATVYLVGSVAIAAVFLHFLMILLLVAAAIFVLAVLGNGEHSGSAVFNPREKEPERCPYCHCTIGFCSCEVHMARFHEEIWKNYH